MPIADFPILSMLRTRMQWHQERQRVLAENVANSDTPNFRARDLREPDLRNTTPTAGVGLARSNPAHFAMIGGNATQFQIDQRGGSDVSPTGNGVSLEDEMMKVAQNQMDFQTATSLYTRSLALIKTAIK